MAGIFSFSSTTVPGCISVTVDDLYKGSFPVNKTVISRGRVYIKVIPEGEETIALLPSNIDGAETKDDVLNAVIEGCGGVPIEEE